MQAGDVADFVILPGDPGRVDFIAEHFDEAKKLLTIENIKLLQEHTKVDRWAHVQGSVVHQLQLLLKNLQILVQRWSVLVLLVQCRNTQELEILLLQLSSKTRRYLPQYMPMEFPAVSSHDMTSALEKAVKASEGKYHLGVVQSKDSFTANIVLTKCLSHRS